VRLSGTSPDVAGGARAEGNDGVAGGAAERVRD
jgi:hypothetical protein